MRLVFCPSRVPLSRHPVVRMVKGRSVVPVGPEDLGKAAFGATFRAPEMFQGGLRSRIPERASRRIGPVALRVESDIEAIRCIRARAGGDPQNPLWPCHLRSEEHTSE